MNNPFITLTQATDKLEIRMNIAHILTYYARHNAPTTMVEMGNGVYDVTETPEQIDELISKRGMDV